MRRNLANAYALLSGAAAMMVFERLGVGKPFVAGIWFSICILNLCISFIYWHNIWKTRKITMCADCTRFPAVVSAFNRQLCGTCYEIAREKYYVKFAGEIESGERDEHDPEFMTALEQKIKG